MTTATVYCDRQLPAAGNISDGNISDCFSESVTSRLVALSAFREQARYTEC
jgi:hypothetical protein